MIPSTVDVTAVIVVAVNVTVPKQLRKLRDRLVNLLVWKLFLSVPSWTNALKKGCLISLSLFLSPSLYSISLWLFISPSCLPLPLLSLSLSLSISLHPSISQSLCLAQGYSGYSPCSLAVRPSWRQDWQQANPHWLLTSVEGLFTVCQPPPVPYHTLPPS